MFPKVLTKYGITPNPMDFGETFVQIYKKVWEVDADIKKASEVTDDTPKVVHPFDTKSASNKAAKKVADELLTNFLTAVDVAITKDAAVAYHLSQSIGNVSAYLTSEVQYYRHKMGEPKPTSNTGNVDELKLDRKELVEFLRMFHETFPALKDDEKVKSAVKYEDGKLALPSIRGRASQTGESDVPTGRYAGRYKQVWTVDGKTFPAGTDPREILRTIYVGPQRVGKKLTTDLWDLVDKAKGKDHKMGDDITVKINGHDVKVSEVKEEANA